MKVTILQLNSVWGNPDENIKKAELLINQAPDSDLYVLPEMWSTGFATEPFGIAEDANECKSLSWMIKMADEHHCAISGSLAISQDGTFKNRHYFVNGRTGVVSYYDKHHLFRYGHEDRYFEPGESHTIVEYMGFRIFVADML